MAEVGIIWADDADLRAIYTYVENARRSIPKFPTIQPLIEDFERWYQGLSWYDVHIMINDTLAEARRRRDELNVAMNQVLPADWVPADRVSTPPGSGANLPGVKPPPPPLIPTWAKVTAVVTGTAITALAILKKVRLI
jgi:hypothetical protein